MEKYIKKLKDYFFSHFAMTKRQRSGFFILILLIVAAQIVLWINPFQPKKQIQAFEPLPEVLALNQESKTESTVADYTLSGTYFINQMDNEQIQRLGFSEKQANSIIKYRYSLGGNFENLEEFAACFVVSDKKSQELQPHLNFKKFKSKETKNYSSYTQSDFKENKTQPKLNLKPFKINQLNQEQWMALGFSEKQVASILKYKNSLPNKEFANAEQFGQCFVVNDYKYQQLLPYIRIDKTQASGKVEPTSEKTQSNKTYFVQNMTEKDWQELGFDAPTSKNIFKHQQFVGGYQNLEELSQCKYISSIELERIKKQLVFQ